jgi:hypothetical protein
MRSDSTEAAMSLHSIPPTFRASFDEGGIEGLYLAHVSALRSSLTYKLFYGILDLVLPVTPLFGIVKDLDRLVGELGVQGGSKIVLGRPPIPWQAVWPERGGEEIRTSPIVVYGTHGSILTPLLLAVALDRSDLKMVGASYIAKLGPNISDCTFPVYATTPLTVKTAGRKGLAPRVIGWLTYKLDPPMARDVGKARNRASLCQAVGHVRGGGGLLIAPDSRLRGEVWRPGLGRLVAQLAEDCGPRPCYLVPWRITGASITGIFHLLSRNPLLRRLGRLRFRRPVQVAFGEPISLQQVINAAGSDPVEITAYLEKDYQRRWS